MSGKNIKLDLLFEDASVKRTLVWLDKVQEQISDHTRGMVTHEEIAYFRQAGHNLKQRIAENLSK